MRESARLHRADRDWLMMANPRDPHGREELMGGDLDEDGGDVTEVSPIVVEAISKALQSHFRAIVELPLPDRLLVLLAELEARERRDEN